MEASAAVCLLCCWGGVAQLLWWKVFADVAKLWPGLCQMAVFPSCFLFFCFSLCHFLSPSVVLFGRFVQDTLQQFQKCYKNLTFWRNLLIFQEDAMCYVLPRVRISMGLKLVYLFTFFICTGPLQMTPAVTKLNQKLLHWIPNHIDIFWLTLELKIKSE